MPKADQIKDDGRFIGLFIGRSGHSKSTAAYSFPGEKKVFDLDGRIRGGIAMPWINRKQIDYTSYPPKTGMGQNNNAVYERLNKDFELLLGGCIANQNPYETVILDSITFQAISVLLDSISLTHSGRGEGKGKYLGTLAMAGPEDYGFQSTSINQVLGFLRSLPIRNIIVTAHIIPKWGKPAGEGGQFKDSIIVGEQLLLTDKLAESVPTMFDNIFKFTKVDQGNRVQYYMSAQGEIARNTLNIPYGDIEITGKDFYNDVLKKYMTLVAREEVKK